MQTAEFGDQETTLVLVCTSKHRPKTSQGKGTMNPRGDTEDKKQKLGERTRRNSEVGRSRVSKPGLEVTLELLPENWTNSANQKRVEGVDGELQMSRR